MTVEEQITKAKKYNLGAESWIDIKSKIIGSIETKFGLGPCDYFSEEGKKRKDEIINKWAEKYYEIEIHNGIDENEAMDNAMYRAVEEFKSMENITQKTYPLMIWTITETDITNLFYTCFNQIKTDYKCKVDSCFFDAKVSSIQDFKQIITKAESGEIDIIVILNSTFAQGELWNLIFAYLKDNCNDDFFMIASSPLEPEKEFKTNWDCGLTGHVRQSVLLVEDIIKART